MCIRFQEENVLNVMLFSLSLAFLYKPSFKKAREDSLKRQLLEYVSI